MKRRTAWSALTDSTHDRGATNHELNDLVAAYVAAGPDKSADEVANAVMIHLDSPSNTPVMVLAGAYKAIQRIAGNMIAKRHNDVTDEVLARHADEAVLRYLSGEEDDIQLRKDREEEKHDHERLADHEAAPFAPCAAMICAASWRC
jgi:hypothetical protein